MKLSEKEQKTLWSVSHRPDTPVSEISKKTGLRDSTVRYCVKSLHEKGIIRRIPVINLSRLGYQEYQLSLSLATKREKLRDQVLDYLIKDRRVQLAIEHGGDYEITAAVVVRDIVEFRQFFSELGEVAQDAIFRKAVSMRQDYYGFGRKYLFGKAVTPVVALKAHHETVEVDDNEHLILKALAVNSDRSNRELARSLGIASTTLEYRLDKLREKKVLQGFIYAVSTELFGVQQFRLKLFASSLREEFSQQLYSFAAKHKQIVNLSSYFGAWDYELTVEVPEMPDALRVSRELQGSFSQQLNEVRVLPVFSLKGLKMYPLEWSSE